MPEVDEDGDGRDLEDRHTFDVWVVAGLLVALAVIVAGTGVPTGILLGGFLAVVALALVAVHTLTL
ncbi:hypothetical protein [Streptomyces sp. NPDC049879]|uniref:hypothetical protein n=1 Tax=Streptomyces sp. NPDC049879 TaxID=3365598 RepID=UPI0037A154B8